jgi:hypothetical protein
MSAQQILLGIRNTIFNAIPSGTTTSDIRAMPARASLLTWQTVFGTNPDAINIVIEASLDNDNWDIIDTSTDVSGEIRSIATGAPFIRARIVSITGGDDISVFAICKTGVIGLENFVQGPSTVDAGSIAIWASAGQLTELEFPGNADKFLAGDGTFKTLTNNGVISLVVDLTPEDIATAFSNPITIIDPPGVGKFINIKKSFAVVQGTIPFALANIGSLSPYYEGLGRQTVGDSGNNGCYPTIGSLHQFSQVGNTSQAYPPIGYIEDAENKAVVISADADDPTGQANLVTIANGGVDYAPGDTFAIPVDNGAGIEGVVDTVDGGGAVLTFHLTNLGWGVLPASDVETNTGIGIGSGLTMNIVSITPANVTVRFYFDYEILDLP